MTVDTIRDLSGRLERHRQVFYKEGGFEAFSTPGLLFYLGYGRELILPDGRPYEAYLNGGKSGLKITFTGPHLRSAGLETELGHVWLTPQGNDLKLHGATSGHETGRADLDTHDFPTVTELVRPFGDWAADGLAQQLIRERENRRIEHELRGRFRLLENSVLTDRNTDKRTLVRQGTAELTEIIETTRQFEEPYRVVPSAEDTAFLGGFIDDSGNTTAGWVPVVEPPSVAGVRLLHVQGPLLS